MSRLVKAFEPPAGPCHVVRNTIRNFWGIPVNLKFCWWLERSEIDSSDWFLLRTSHRKDALSWHQLPMVSLTRRDLPDINPMGHQTALARGSTMGWGITLKSLRSSMEHTPWPWNVDLRRVRTCFKLTGTELRLGALWSFVGSVNETNTLGGVPGLRHDVRSLRGQELSSHKDNCHLRSLSKKGICQQS